MAKITADLKGVPFEKKLVWKTGEGFNVNPFYRAEDTGANSEKSFSFNSAIILVILILVLVIVQ